jgi:hypothetical protein
MIPAGRKGCRGVTMPLLLLLLCTSRGYRSSVNTRAKGRYEWKDDNVKGSEEPYFGAFWLHDAEPTQNTLKKD